MKNNHITLSFHFNEEDFERADTMRLKAGGGIMTDKVRTLILSTFKEGDMTIPLSAFHLSHPFEHERTGNISYFLRIAVMNLGVKNHKSGHDYTFRVVISTAEIMKNDLFMSYLPNGSREDVETLLDIVADSPVHVYPSRISRLLRKHKYLRPLVNAISYCKADIAMKIINS